MLKKASRESEKHSFAWMTVLLCVTLMILSPGRGLAEGKKADAQKAAAPLVDINNASEQELAGIKGVDRETAKKIVANRPYKTLADLSRAGISAKAIVAMKPFVAVGKVKTVPADTPAVATDMKKTAGDRTGKTAKSTPAAATQLARGTKININTATQEALERLPGIGPVKAKAIMKGRPYKTIEEVMKVPGVKEKTFAAVKDYLTVK
ncbi:MAG: helix-hairpin-helix domain-containing protein [Deltaproteobacteria bacterium]|nr:helix-hairpin-helix domain-containing protein [Deltaproteobacteria bacterium]